MSMLKIIFKLLLITQLSSCTIQLCYTCIDNECDKKDEQMNTVVQELDTSKKTIYLKDEKKKNEKIRKPSLDSSINLFSN